MRQAFSSYIIKRRAREAMRGRFFTAFWAAVIPMAVVTLAAVLVFSLIPGANETFEPMLNGQFASIEERELYFNSVADICMQCVNLFSALFAFLSVGAQRLFLDMIRGKEVKIRNVFRYFNKWHIAIIYPALTAAVVTLIREVLDMLLASGVNYEVVTLLAWVIQLALYFVACKLMFFELALADNDCTSFIDAAKASWRMVGWSTVVNSVILLLSFIGWVLAAAFTAGIAFLYLMPYMGLALAAFYEMQNAECGMQN